MYNKSNNLIILGSGPAGYTAAIYAARANLNPIIIAGNQRGGQLTTTIKIDNWPGCSSNLNASKLIEDMESHVKRLDVKIIDDHIIKASLSANSIELYSTNSKCYIAKSLIIATGAKPKYLNIESEMKYINRGVSLCAVCDGFFFKNENVVVIGGGSNAIESALYLSNLAKNVFLVHRREVFRSEKILSDKLINKSKNGNIKIFYNYTLKEIKGNGKFVNEVEILNVISGGSKMLSVTGVFVCIGHTPNTELFDGQIDMNNGYIKVRGGINGNATATSMLGVFAAGDVQDMIYKQAITSAGSGCMAALDAEKYIESIL